MTLLVTIKSLGDVYFGNDDDGDGCGQTGAVDRIDIYIHSKYPYHETPRKLNSPYTAYHEEDTCSLPQKPSCRRCLFSLFAFLSLELYPPASWYDFGG